MAGTALNARTARLVMPSPGARSTLQPAVRRQGGDEALTTGRRHRSATVTTTPVHVTIHAETAAVTTKTDTGTVSRRTRLDAAASALTSAHRIVSRLNSRRIPGRMLTSGARGRSRRRSGR